MLVMADPWTNPKLKDLTKLPGILAGPILRQVGPTSATVWLALIEPQDMSQTFDVTLSVYEAPGGATLGPLVLQGNQTAVQVGDHVYLLAVTARNGKGLSPGVMYQYDIEVNPGGKLSDVGSHLFTAEDASIVGRLTYGDFVLPTFCLPPDDWKQLRLFHGSCRKPHADGLDGLLALDALLSTGFALKDRPHLMLHTGDQIYADDVAHALLVMLQDAGQLFFKDEAKLSGLDDDDYKAGHRSDAVTNEKKCGLTSDNNVNQSHLFLASEFFSMYLFAWSDVLWPDPAVWPKFSDVFPEIPEKRVTGTGDETALDTMPAQEFKKQISNLQTFREGLPKVRRALANIPNYMICDDHEITDDWYITQNWVNQVMADSCPGRTVIRNGVLAFALFQAWGTLPDQFLPGTIGATLLDAISPPWKGEKSPGIETCLGMPPAATLFVDETGTNETGTRYVKMNRDDAANSLKYYFQLDFKNYQILVLDTRNWRSYPEGTHFPPCLLSGEAFDNQITNAKPAVGNTADLTIVVSPAVPMAIAIVEVFQEQHDERNVLENDIEGWKNQKRAFESLIGRIVGRPGTGISGTQKIVVLSGDVHHGYAVRMDYEAENPYGAAPGPPKTQAVFAMFTSSALKNEELKTWAVGKTGYSPINPRAEKTFVGWATANEKKIGLVTDTSEGSVNVEDWIVSGSPAVVQLTHGVSDYALDPLVTPDWKYHFEFQLSYKGENANVAKIDTSGDNKKDFAGATRVHGALSTKYFAGSEIVGMNNFGEVVFELNLEGKVDAIQRLWWTEAAQSPFVRKTSYYITLDFKNVEL
jgi:hypothetical protein